MPLATRVAVCGWHLWGACWSVSGLTGLTKPVALPSALHRASSPYFRYGALARLGPREIDLGLVESIQSKHAAGRSVRRELPWCAASQRMR